MAEKNVTRGRVVRAEWEKVKSLRSTWYMLIVSAATPYLFALLIGAAVHLGNAKKIQMDPVLVSLCGLNFAQLILPMLGILMVTTEYTTGTIRPTLTAVPNRVWVLVAKLTVLVRVIIPLFAVVAISVFLLAQLLVRGSHLEAPFAAPETLRALAGVPLSLALLGAIGLGVGTLARSTPLAIGLFLGLLTMLPQGLTILPYKWAHTVSNYMPLKASESLMSAHPGPDHASVAASLLALTLWAACAVVSSAVVFARRDV